MKVRLTIEIDLNKNLINFYDDDERMWVENEILLGNRTLMVHSNEIGDCIGEVTSVKKLTWLGDKNQSNRLACKSCGTPARIIQQG